MLFNVVQNGSRLFKMVQSCSKWFKVVQNGSRGGGARRDHDIL
jgi:hypothetical protein